MIIGDFVAKKTKKKIKKSVIFRGFSLLFFLISVIIVFHVYRLGVLPINYFLIFIGILLALNFLIYQMVGSTHWKKRMIGSFLALFFSIILGAGIFYSSTTLQFLESAFQSRERIENYQVLVLNSSNYGSLKELKGGKIGVPFANFSEGARKMQEELRKKTTLTLQESENSSLVESLLHKNLRVIVMEEAQKNLFVEMNEEFKNEVKVLETISVSVPNKVKKRDTKLTKDSFHIYVSGNDEYGTINQVSRSDVNMILTVNPITHKVLLTSIPRDYYVTLAGMNDAKDKLTHASLYGIDTSVKTLENLLDISIDYYVKINFSSLVSLVDAVDGIEVESDEAFTAHYYDEPVNEWVTYTFNEGINQLNGKQALAFSRERKSFTLGDRARAKHQQMVLSALIHKVSSPSILKNYTKLLNALNGSFDTNLSYEDILSFLQYQIDKNPSWTIESNVLEGTDGKEHVYSMSSTTYVMKPSLESIEEAKKSIQIILKNES